MDDIFPEPVLNLPKADIPSDAVRAYISQSSTHQIIFMQFNEDFDVPEHSHAAQFAIVLEGKIELFLDGRMRTFIKGDRYYIQANVVHYGKIYAGYSDISFFDEPHRYPHAK